MNFRCCKMYEVELREIDSQGRFTIPAKWREQAMKEAKEVYVLMYPDHLKVLPKRKVDLTKYFDSVEIDVPLENFSDYHRLRKLLRKV